MANILRPTTWDDYVGQERAKDTLDDALWVSNRENKPLAHTLFIGPPGVGKTTLAIIIANMQGGKCITASAPAINSTEDLADLLAELNEKDVLFIDEIHRLSIGVAESLYSVMEDFIITAKFNNRKTIETCWVPKCTIIGASTHLGDIPKPLQTRFGIILDLEPYTIEDLKEILKRASKKMGIEYTDDSYEVIARRSKGTARVALNYLERVKETAIRRFNSFATKECAELVFERLGIDEIGLDKKDYKYLKCLLNVNRKGVRLIAAEIGEQESTVKENIEPYLANLNFIEHTSSGRKITEKGKIYILSKEYQNE